MCVYVCVCQGDVEGDKRLNPPHRCALSLLFSTSGDLVGDGGESRRARRQVLPRIGWARLADSSAQGISGLYLTLRHFPLHPRRGATGVLREVGTAHATPARKSKAFKVEM